MKENTIILGKRSYLSSELEKKIEESEIYSLDEFPYYKIKNKKHNIIINSFYSSYKLKKIENYEEFFNKSLLELSKFLDKFPKSRIKKIIYTSSSGIYNSINDLEFQDTRNRKIYSSTKFAAENLIKNFCTKNDIKFSIMRVFNIFGDKEEFSIISKILSCYKKKDKTLKLINNGDSVRDFIHINEVVNFYKQIINDNQNKIIDVGSGYGYSIKNIIDELGAKNFKIKTSKNVENSFSIANNINKKLNKKNSLENFLIKKLNLNKTIQLNKILSNKKNILHDYL